MIIDNQLMHKRIHNNGILALFAFCFLLSFCFLGINSSFAQANLFDNGGFESGTADSYWTNVTSWTANRETNGMLIADASEAQEGTNYIRISANGGTTLYLNQDVAATAGTVYEMDGYLKTPDGANQFNPENAYITLTVKFYGSAGKIAEWSTRDIGNGALDTNWVKFTTAPMVAPVGTTNIKAYVLYMRGVPADTTTVGYVYVDNLRLFESAPAQSGQLKNCDFETQPYGYGPSTNFTYWTEQYADAFGVTTNAARSGKSSLQFWYTGSGLQQSWAATSGVRYTSGGYLMTPSWAPMASTCAIAMIYIDYLNTTGGVIAQVTSSHFTSNAAKDVWTYLAASGVAPAGTVTGRTTCCVVVDDTNFSGSVFFDDITQVGASTTQTVAGLLYNPGFEDGTTGNANYLSNALPNWGWAGGTNAGFIVTDQAHDGYQSYQVVFPNNLAYQWFDATPGQAYVIGGYLRHPLGGLVEGDNGVTDTTAYASILCEFYNAEGNVATTSVSVASSQKLTYQTPTDTWIYFAVTNHAPYSGPCSGKVSAAYLDLDTNSIVVGSVFFDSFSVTETNIVKTDTQAGALWNPGFEYSAQGTKLQYIDKWEGLGFEGMIDDTYSRSGGQALKISYVETLAAQYWDATPGNRYSTEGYVASPSGEFALTGSTGSYAMVIIQYLNDTGGVIASYSSDAFWATNYTVDTWTHLSAEGRAPSGTVTGRTLCALLGNDDAFGGAVWFDDMTQTLVATSSTTQDGEVYNPGFEDGDLGNVYDLWMADALPNWEWIGGTNAGFLVDSAAESGYQSLQIVFPNNLAAQWFDATAGQAYVVDGYMMNPSVGGITDTTAFASFLLEFYDANGDLATTSVSSVSTEKMTYESDKDTWIYFAVTNHAPYSTPCSGKVTCAYLDLDTNSIVVGSVFFDSVGVNTTNITKTDVQAGALWNPGFEYSANGTKLQYLDSWEGLGFDGAIDNTYFRSGGQALKIFYVETLAAQYWDANEGWRYRTEGYVASPSNEFALVGSTGSYAMVIIQYMDDTGGVLSAFTSDPFWATNYTPDTWTHLSAEGRAPSGTVTGRTLCALLGNDDAFGGAVWFDDMTQTVVNTGGITTGGEIGNPGFEDGDLGNTYYLGSSLPDWEWAGGTNAGFIVGDVAEEGYQSGLIVFPNNLLYQWFDAETGMSYIVDGYILTPATGGITDQTAYASLLLEFFNADGDAVTSSVSVVSTEVVDYQSDKGIWHHVSVTNHAPWSGPCSGKVSCAYLDLDTNSIVVGSVYFDNISVIATNIPLDENSNSGGIWNPGFEYSASGTKFRFIDSWENLGFDGQIDSGYTRTGDNALKITYPETLLASYWDATPGHKYETAAWVSSPSGDDNFTTSTNCRALLLMQFFDDTGTNILITYESDPYDGTATADVWSNLSIIGVAPANAVSGRTVCAVLGYDDAFGGAVWFDDLTHELLATAPTMAGMISNPGFDDGAPGNANTLVTNDFMYGWQWFGGDDAGYLVRDYQYDGQQSFLMTWPNNFVVQDFTCLSGGTYIAEGYMYTPAALKFDSDGSAYGEVTLSFYVDSAVDPDEASIVHSEPFTRNNSADVWTYFCITGQAPAHAVVTGRVSCTIYSPDPMDDLDLAGVICYDGLSVTEVGGVSAWETWQTENFGSTTDPNTGPTEDYDGDAYDNWSEFIAGTAPTNNNSFLSIAGISQNGGTETVISWPSVAGRYYALAVATNLVDGEFTQVTNNIVATPSQNVYTTTPPASVGRYFYKIEVSTNLFE